MKKALLIVCILSVMLLVSLPVFAELSVYTYSQTTGTYTEITGGLLLGTATSDNQRFVDPAVPVGITAAPFTGPGLPLGFDFTFNDYVFDVIAINANGWISFGQSDLGATAVDITSSNNYACLSATNTITPAQLFNRVAGFGRDLQSQAGASIRLETVGTAPDRVCIIQWKDYKRYGNTGSGDFLNFQIQLHETSNMVSFAYGAFTHGTNTSTAHPQVGMRGPLATDFANRTTTTDWSETTDGTANNASCSFLPTVVPPNGLVFEYTPPVPVANDMQALSITGDLTPIQDSPSEYTVTIKNGGISPETTYFVKLMSGTTELTSVAGPAIQPQEIIEVPISYTFTITGPMSIYATVVLTGDLNPDNDDTGELDLIIQPAGVVTWDIGAGDQEARAPIDMYWNNSLYECIYLSSEIYLSGQITGITFYNNFVSANIMDKPTRIWLGETTQTNLSGGWIPSTQLTSVFDGNVDYPVAQNNITIVFPTAYQYNGGNLVLMVHRPMDTVHYNSADNFFCQTVGTARALKLYSDSIVFDPANPETASPTGQFPMTTFSFLTENIGSISGTVISGGNPLEDANVVLEGTQFTVITGPDGTYNFPFVYSGQRDVTCTKEGYVEQTSTVTVVEDQNTVADFDMIVIPELNVTGTILGNDAQNGLADATVSLTGDNDYTATTDAQGQFTIAGVNGYATYTYTITKTDYQELSGNIVLEGTDYDMGTFTMNENAYPVTNVVAVEVSPIVNVSWESPNPIPAGWIRWDSGINDDSIGTGEADDFIMASRWRLEDLAEFIDQSLYAVEFWPAEVACTYTVRVWTGGNSTNPGTMVIDQEVTNPTIDAFNVVVLDTPVPIPLGEELWFGVRCNTTTGYPAGCDAGPAHAGLGNMMYYDGEWTTLLDLAPTLDYDWNLGGYIGFGEPAAGSEPLQPIAFNDSRTSNGIMSASGRLNRIQTVSANTRTETRSIEGFNVWRLPQGEENNEAAWTLLTPDPITSTNFSDLDWNEVPNGPFKWAVKAIYTNDVFSNAALSNVIYHTGNDDNTEVPLITLLSGNYPNPFNPETSISYSIKNSTPVVIDIFNTRGQRIRTLVNETKAAGNYSVKWDGTDENNQKVSSGVYFYKMNAGKYSSSKKMILMK